MLSFGVLYRAVLLVAACAWCYYILKRLPSDIGEIIDARKKYKHAPQEAKEMDSPAKQKDYIKKCKYDFYATVLGHALFFWLITVFAAIFAVTNLIWIGSSIFSGISAL